MNDFNAVIKKIKSSKSIVLGCHKNPDGDTIGSMLALGLGLEKMGKKVFYLSQDGVPARYVFLPGAKKIKQRLNKKVDLAISLDCNSPAMLGTTYRYFQNASTIIDIDHHEVRVKFGAISLIDEKASAVGEMVYKVLVALKVKVDKDIAENILTSVIVETNSFKLPNVNPSVFNLCANLMGTGVDFYRLADEVFWSRRRQNALLSGMCLSRCKFSENGRLVWSLIRMSDFKKYQGKDEDVDAVADEMRSIKGVKIVVFFREKSEKELRVSLRSSKDINIVSVAEFYGGGGHYNIAGCLIPNSRKKIVELLKLATLLLE
jgi:bifunctional oligoribonuclease and PAP phosphatase NrnA